MYLKHNSLTLSSESDNKQSRNNESYHTSIYFACGLVPSHRVSIWEPAVTSSVHIVLKYLNVDEGGRVSLIWFLVTVLEDVEVAFSDTWIQVVLPEIKILNLNSYLVWNWVYEYRSSLFFFNQFSCSFLAGLVSNCPVTPTESTLPFLFLFFNLLFALLLTLLLSFLAPKLFLVITVHFDSLVFC